MIEGCDKETPRKSVFALDLTQSRETRKLEKGGPLLKKIGDMFSPKAAPVALPTPDGKKIVVFTTLNLEYYLGPPRSGLCDFELFDPVSNTWEQLPSIMRDHPFIQAYGFIPGSNKLVVQVPLSGLYALDLTEPGEGWEKLDTIYDGVERISNLSPCAPRPSFFETVGGGRYCFVNNLGFYDLEEYADKYDPDEVDTRGFDAPPKTFVLELIIWLLLWILVWLV